MVDIARDARWGRIAEGAGEDSYLGARCAAARVRGFQGEDPSAPDRVLSCAKHFIAYGAACGGRDYNNADLSEQTLREAVSADVHQCDTRIKVIEGDRPLLSPMLTVDGLTAEQLREAVDGRRESGGKALILYAADGKYDLSALAG